MKAAWLLGALVVPQLLGFGHGARGPGREWAGGWGGALEEERQRESLMLKNLQEVLGLPTGVGNKDTKEQQEEEGEETATAPTSRPSPVPSPSPTPEDTITYICEYPEVRVPCLHITDPSGGQTHQGSPESSDVPVKGPSPYYLIHPIFGSPRAVPSLVLRVPDCASRCISCPFTVGRLAGLDAGLHQLHIRLHALDTRVVQLTQGLRQLRDATSDTGDSVQALKEAQVRAEQEHGRLEGCLKGLRLGHKCFLLSRDFETQAAAQARCKARGGSLAQPVDRQQMDAVGRYLRAALAPYNWPVWLGVNDRRSEGLYLFENGQRVSFFAWHRAPSPEPGARPSAASHPLSPDQPNGGVLENCVAQASDDGSWWDHDCERRLYFVCEFPF